MEKENTSLHIYLIDSDYKIESKQIQCIPNRSYYLCICAA